MSRIMIPGGRVQIHGRGSDGGATWEAVYIGPASGHGWHDIKRPQGGGTHRVPESAIETVKGESDDDR